MIRTGTPPYLEVSSRGDRRFSAFHAKIKQRNNKSIEDLYQAYKIFEDGKTNLSWKEAKGKRPVNIKESHEFYSQLWDDYFEENPYLLKIIKRINGFSDIFGQEGHCCQALELWRIRNTPFYREIKGSLLDAEEDFIVHQTNCVTRGSAEGLTYTIFKMYPYADVYHLRIESDEPGSIIVSYGENKQDKNVIALMGQVYPGRSRTWGNDTAEKRLGYFNLGLERISQIPNLFSIAFPKYIGCGLAGGNWKHYEQILKTFSQNNPLIMVYIYDNS